MINVNHHFKELIKSNLINDTLHKNKDDKIFNKKNSKRSDFLNNILGSSQFENSILPKINNNIFYKNPNTIFNIKNKRKKIFFSNKEELNNELNIKATNKFLSHPKYNKKGTVKFDFNNTKKINTENIQVIKKSNSNYQNKNIIRKNIFIIKNPIITSKKTKPKAKLNDSINNKVLIDLLSSKFLNNKKEKPLIKNNGHTISESSIDKFNITFKNFKED